MKKLLLIVVLIFGAVTAIVGPRLPRLGSQASVVGPADVVQAFYGDYLSHIGEGDARRNPLVDGMYRESPYLAPQFVAEVDRLIAGFEKGGFDPFLMAQDVPESVTAGKAVITGKTAVVPVTTSFPGHHFSVTLQQEADGGWVITSITPGR